MSLAALPSTAGVLQQLPHDQLRPSDLNPRKHPRTDQQLDELAASIAAKGILQNLVARPMVGVATDDGRQVYEIAAGEGRWRAMGRLLERGEVPAETPLPVSVRDLGDDDIVEIGLIENLQRRDLSPLEEGRAFQQLHTSATRRGGKKAAGKMVAKIANTIGKSERYVEKRIALARDLAPQAAGWLDNGRMDLAAAQLFAAAPAKLQAALVKDWTADDADAVANGEEPSAIEADDVVQALENRLREITPRILFDRAAYTGPTVEHRGREYATDAEQFDKLQNTAAAELTKTLRQQAKDGDIAFFEQLKGYHFPSHLYDQESDAAGGVALLKKPNGDVEIYRGLTKKKGAVDTGPSYGSSEWTKDQDRRARERKVTEARREAKRILDPRPGIVRDHCAGNPRTLLAMSILETLTEDGWFGDNNNGRWFDVATHNNDYDSHEAVAAAGMKVLRQAGSVPKGDKLLPWLLDQTLTTLAGAWAAMHAASHDFREIDDWDFVKEPSANEAAIFEHCGAELPEDFLEKAKAEAKARVDALGSKKKSEAKVKKKGGRK